MLENYYGLATHTCCHCGVVIKHFSGRLWHAIGEPIFPQYCATKYNPIDGSILPAQLHEPKKEEDQDE